MENSVLVPPLKGICSPRKDVRNGSGPVKPIEALDRFLPVQLRDPFPGATASAAAAVFSASNLPRISKAYPARYLSSCIPELFSGCGRIWGWTWC